MKATGMSEPVRVTPPEPATPIAAPQPDFFRGLLFALPLTLLVWAVVAAALFWLL
jgi:hypothetical protein